MFKLRRLSQQPILEPIEQHDWERAAVFNCGVTLHQGRVHMIYRASDRDFSALSDSEPKGKQEVCFFLWLCGK